MLQELRFGVRMLLKQPGFSLIAVLTLALGIGATSAVFSLIQGVLLTPPPYRQPQELAPIPSARADGQKLTTRRVARPAMDGMAEGGEVFRRHPATWDLQFSRPLEGSESIEGMVVTKDYFHVTGLEPVLGRTFVESETGAGPVRVIVLGYELWQRKFNADPQIIGKTGAHQPLGYAAHGDRRDASGRPLSALSDERARAELQRERDGGFLDSGDSRSEAAGLGRGGATAEWRRDRAGAR